MLSAISYTWSPSSGPINSLVLSPHSAFLPHRDTQCPDPYFLLVCLSLFGLISSLKHMILHLNPLNITFNLCLFASSAWNDHHSRSTSAICLLCSVTIEGNYHWIDWYHQSMVLNFRYTFQASSLSFYLSLVSSFHYCQVLFQYLPISPIPLLTFHPLTLGQLGQFHVFLYHKKKSWAEHPYTYFYFTWEFFLNSKLLELAMLIAVIWFTTQSTVLPLPRTLYWDSSYQGHQSFYFAKPNSYA